VHQEISRAGAAGYCASKGGLRNLTRVLAPFLASSAADYVTGSTYVMDGGLMQNTGQGA
jgi:NAD(P)-dependent dehydrogenase (short-subunit alcohol dehydrogenase family)